MTTILIDQSINQPILEQINTYLNGTVKDENGLKSLDFDNELGKGTIRKINFDWGIALMDYDVFFAEETKFVFKLDHERPIEFLFVSEGTIMYAPNGEESSFVKLNRYQNVILSNKPESRNTYIYPNRKRVRLNVIQMVSDKYQSKSHNNLHDLPDSLLEVFKNNTNAKPYQHLGNYNLKINSLVQKIKQNDTSGIIGSLTIEAQLNLILALQILENKNFESKIQLPNSISKINIKTIKAISDHIDDNIGDQLKIEDLAKQYNLNPKKLQVGFKVLYGKSVNKVIRERKLEYARELIEKTDLSISEIVYNIGYKSRSYFSKIFFEHYNILPIDYKDKVRRTTTYSLK